MQQQYFNPQVQQQAGQQVMPQNRMPEPPVNDNRDLLLQRNLRLK